MKQRGAALCPEDNRILDHRVDIEWHLLPDMLVVIVFGGNGNVTVNALSCRGGMEITDIGPWLE